MGGADLSELCQLAAKAAVGDPNAMEGDIQAEITRKHFEEGFSHARRSVNQADLNKYDHFRKSFDPLYRSESGGGGDVINWPEDDTQIQLRPTMMRTTSTPEPQVTLT